MYNDKRVQYKKDSLRIILTIATAVYLRKSLKIF